MSDDLPEGWEEWLAYFAAWLPQPVEQATSDDGSVTFRAGDPGEVVVRLSSRTITVSVFSVQWATPYEPLVVARRVGTVRWARLPSEHAMAVVEALIAAARAARRASFRTCERCERTLPPEWMADGSLCQSCAAHEAKVVF